MKGRIVGDRYEIDGAAVTRAEFFARMACGAGAGQPGASLCGAWNRPVVSEALAVHPEQIAEQKEFYRRRGLSVDFTPDGRPILRDRAHRRRVLRANNVFDKDGGYGDG